MSSPNEQRTRAGYDLFMAANPEIDSHWDVASPLAATMDENIVWFDDDKYRGAAEPTYSGREAVLGRLRELRREMLNCNLLSCSEPADGLVHTLDHAVMVDESAYRQTRPQLCASSFTFGADGRTTGVRYCSTQMTLHLPMIPESGS